MTKHSTFAKVWSYATLLLIAIFLMPTDGTAQSIDLELSLSSANANAGIFQNVTITATITNNGSGTATGVMLEFPTFPSDLPVTGDPIESQGFFSNWWTGTGTWNVGTLAAGASATVDIGLFPLAEDLDFYGEVAAATGTDADSSPGNGTSPNPNEDDEAVITINDTGGGACELTALVSNILCSDNGTPDFEFDDMFQFEITVNGQNTSGSWTADLPIPSASSDVLNGTVGSPSSAIFDINSVNALPDGVLTFVVEDVNDGSCSTIVSITPPATCSDGGNCDITILVNNNGCNDNGTPNNPADDYLDVSFVVEGQNASPNGYQLTVSLSGTTTASYGQTFTGQPLISALNGLNSGIFRITAVDLDNPNCMDEVEVLAPLPCSNGGGQCSFTPEVTNIQCFDNGTPNDPSDDTLSFDFNAVNSNNNSAYIATIGGQSFFGAFNQTTSFGLFAIADGDITLTIADMNGIPCGDPVTIEAPAPCSNGGQCNLSSVVSNVVCNNNGTPNNTGDDTFDFSFRITGTNGAAIYNLSGDLPQTLTLDYGTTYEFTDYPISGGNLSFIATDFLDSNCQSGFEVSVSATCSNGNGGDIDLELTLSGTSANAVIYGSGTVTATITNLGQSTATNVQVSAPSPIGFVYEGGNAFTASQGTFSTFGNQVWTVGSLAAGATATLELNYFFLTNPNSVTNYAQVVAANEQDSDSTPNNGTCCTPNEDDEAAFTFGGVTLLPDLTLSNLVEDFPNTLIVGTEYPFTVNLNNIGNTIASGDYRVGIYLSLNQSLDASDYLIGEIDTGNSTVGTLPNTPGLIKVESNVPPQFNYSVILVIDDLNEITESNENNNLLLANQTFAVENSNLPCSGAFLATTQAELELFNPTCTTWDGSISIQGTVTDLSPLSNLTEIIGTLAIESVPITNTDGLDNLEKVGGNLIFNSTDINSFNLPNLQEAGTLFLYFNESLTTLTGLPSTLTTQSIQIIGNSVLNNLGELPTILNSDIDNLTIANNANLVNISGLSTFSGSYPDLDLVVSTNPNISSLAGLENITQVESLLVDENPNLSECCAIFDLLNTGGVLGNITILNNLSGCNSEQDILDNCGSNLCSGTFVATTQAELNQFDASCTVWDGSIELSGFNISDLSPLSNLVEITGSLRIEETYITSFIDLQNLQAVNGLILLNNGEFNTTFGLSPTLATPLFQISGSFQLGNLGNLPDPSALQQLIITNNPTLISIPGFTSLNGSYPNLEITLSDLGNLTSLNDLQNITQLKSLTIGDFSSLVPLTGLGNITNLESLFIVNNQTLTDCCAIFDLLSNGGVSDVVEIANNTFGCNSEQDILASCPNEPCNGFFQASTQAELEQFNQNCTFWVGTIFIGGSVTDLSPLNNLINIQGGLNVNGTGVTDLSGLNNLETVSSVTILNNDLLNSLTGLENMTDVFNLNIQNNDVLTECCAIVDLLNNNGVEGTTTIANNLSGCNSEQDILDNCSASGCQITATVQEIQCQSNLTLTDGSDDTYTARILVEGSADCFGNYKIDGQLAGIFGSQAVFGQIATVGPFPIADGNVTIEITDVDGNNGILVTLTAPAPCSDGIAPNECGFENTYPSVPTDFVNLRTQAAIETNNAYEVSTFGNTSGNTTFSYYDLSIDFAGNEVASSATPLPNGYIKRAADGNFLTVTELPNNQLEIAKVTPNGTVIWANDFDFDSGGPQSAPEVRDIIDLPDGYAIFVSAFGPTDKGWIVKTDNNGGLVYNTNLPTLTDIRSTKFVGIAANGDFLISREDSSRTYYLMRNSATDGTLIYNISINGDLVINSVGGFDETPDGNFIYAAYDEQFNDVYLKKLDAFTGEKVWELILTNTFSPDDYDPLSFGGIIDVAATLDGGAVVGYLAGSAFRYGRLSAAGNLVWTRTLPSTYNLQARTRTSDGGFIFTGNINDEFGVVKTTSEGLLTPTCVDGGGNCTLNNQGVTTVCDDNGSPNDPLDDIWFVEINPTGSNIGATYDISGDLEAAGVPYGSPQTFGGGAITSEPSYTFMITDESGDCARTFTIDAPMPCSNGGSNGVDLELDITSSTPFSQYQNVVFEVNLTNAGIDQVDDVTIYIYGPEGGVYAGGSEGNATSGTFFPDNGGTSTWNLSNLAGGETEVLSLNVFVLDPNEVTIWAEVQYQSTVDDDSTPFSYFPTLGTPLEDDEDRLTLSNMPAPSSFIGGNSTNEHTAEGLYFKNLFPNPTTQSLKLEVASSEVCTAILQISGVSGSVAQQNNLSLEKGINTVELEVSDLPTGVYFLKIETESEVLVKRFLKQ